MLVYSGYGETVFRACFVEVGEVDAHSPAPAMLLYEDHIRIPL